MTGYILLPDYDNRLPCKRAVAEPVEQVKNVLNDRSVAYGFGVSFSSVSFSSLLLFDATTNVRTGSIYNDPKTSYMPALYRGGKKSQVETT